MRKPNKSIFCLENVLLETFFYFEEKLTKMETKQESQLQKVVGPKNLIIF